MFTDTGGTRLSSDALVVVGNAGRPARCGDKVSDASGGMVNERFKVEAFHDLRLQVAALDTLGQIRIGCASGYVLGSLEVQDLRALCKYLWQGQVPCRP